MGAMLNGRRIREVETCDAHLARDRTERVPLVILGPEGRKQMRSLGEVASIGIEMAVSISVGYFGGGWLDSKLGTGWLQWVGLGLGIVAGYLSLYRLARKTNKTLQKPPEGPNAP
jgi:ATP synthase protein I